MQSIVVHIYSQCFIFDRDRESFHFLGHGVIAFAFPFPYSHVQGIKLDRTGSNRFFLKERIAHREKL